jgi:hypothetical protein
VTRLLPATLIAVAVSGVVLATSAVTPASGRTRIAATFVTHNEESISNPPCEPVLTDRARFLDNRAATIAFAEMVSSRGAALNVQSEWEYQLRVADWEDAAVRATTGGRNVLQYLNTMAPGRVEVDAHSHEKRGYNYADVAALLQSHGVPPNGVVGGFTWWPTSAATWPRFETPLDALRYRYTWEASILWGGAGGGHRMDSRASGLWRPAAVDDFHTHDPEQRLINVGDFPGAGTSAHDGLAGLLDELRAGRLKPGHLYTATFITPQCELDTDPTLYTDAATLIDDFAGAVDAGELVWAPLTEIVRMWEDEYGSEPTIYRP